MGNGYGLSDFLQTFRDIGINAGHLKTFESLSAIQPPQRMTPI